MGFSRQEYWSGFDSSFSRGSSQPRDQTHISQILCMDRQVLYHSVQFSLVSQVPLFLQPHELQHTRLPCPSALPELAQTHVHRVGDAIQPSQPSQPLLLLPSIYPNIRVFSSESALPIRWTKYRSFSFSISPCNEYSGLISLRIDWFDLLEVQGTLKSLLQHHGSKASIIQHSAFIQTTKIMASSPITSWQTDGETVETVADFILRGSKITADGDCSYEIKRRLLFGRKVMTNLDSILKSRDITFPTKGCLVKAMVFPVVMYGCESWTIKKTER